MSQRTFGGVHTRKRGALLRLEAQLQSKTKNTKKGIVPLEENDVKRIGKEITTLKSKL